MQGCLETLWIVVRRFHATWQGINDGKQVHFLVQALTTGLAHVNKIEFGVLGVACKGPSIFEVVFGCLHHGCAIFKIRLQASVKALVVGIA